MKEVVKGGGRKGMTRKNIYREHIYKMWATVVASP